MRAENSQRRAGRRRYRTTATARGKGGGARVAGPYASCYAQMNGNEAAIFSLDEKPGSLCAAREPRKGLAAKLTTPWAHA